jgi:hypothetical protein
MQSAWPFSPKTCNWPVVLGEEAAVTLAESQTKKGDFAYENHPTRQYLPGPKLVLSISGRGIAY